MMCIVYIYIYVYIYTYIHIGSPYSGKLSATLTNKNYVKNTIDTRCIHERQVDTLQIFLQILSSVDPTFEFWRLHLSRLKNPKIQKIQVN